MLESEGSAFAPAGEKLTSIATEIVDLTQSDVSDPAAGDGQPLPPTIGRYRILRLLGEGGMGAVYEAKRTPHRTVALKVIRAGYASGEMLRRFENETQALGRLLTPGSRRFTTRPAGPDASRISPWSWCRARRACMYCEHHKLNVPQRLELVAKICDASACPSAGADPSRLEAGEHPGGGNGEPRILDFGVARLTDSDAQATRQTDIGPVDGGPWRT